MAKGFSIRVNSVEAKHPLYSKDRMMIMEKWEIRLERKTEAHVRRCTIIHNLDSLFGNRLSHGVGRGRY